MHMLFNLFYRQFGTRRLQQLIAPRLFNLTSLPRDSIVHYLSVEAGQPNIDTSAVYFSDYAKKILVDYPEVLTEIKGNPKKKPLVIRNLVRDFHSKNKDFRYVREHYKVYKDPLTLMIFNYSYLNELYRYPTMPMTDYYRWYNTHKTMVDIFHTVGQVSNKEHFVFIKAPADVPSFNMLQIYSARLNPTLARIFDTPEKRFVLEIWKWLSVQYREQSIFAKLSAVDCTRVNIVFTIDDGRSTIINLGYLNSWIKESENLTEFTNIAQYTPIQIQKLFLKFLMVLTSSKNVEEIVDPESGINNQTGNVNPEDVVDDPDTGDIEEDIDATEINNKGLLSSTGSIQKLKEVDDESITSDNIDLDKQLSEIEDDLKTLDQINAKQLKDRGLHLDKNGEEILVDETIPDITPEQAHKLVYEDHSVEEELSKQLNRQAEFGLISALDYRKLNNDINRYQNMKNPYDNKKTVAEYLKIDPSELKISDEKTVMSDSPTIIDKSMLKSSLLSFDEDYINKIQNKDILSMTHTLQRAGIIVRNHEVELDSSALGEYENHTIELKPIDGAPSTLRFRIPKIQEDGTFTASGNKYVMRKQRVDVPIRKINPFTVSLSSYYGKTFIALSQKKANSSVEWVIRQLNLLGYEEGSHVVKIAPANVFDNNFEAPFIYNALAAHYKLVKTTEYTLVFDHTEREKMTSLELLSKIEKNNSRVVGYTNATVKELIVVNDENEFFIYRKDVLLPIGNIFTVFKLNELKAPIDFSEVRIFSKNIPVGIVLAYYIGFTALVALLNATYRKVENRKNKELKQDEYAISFENETYIFSRKQRVASMILGGFLEFEKEIRQYPTITFNNKDVYFNLLSSKGLTSIYVREMELTQQLFVDSITKEILQEMGEPVTFNGLLIRATELLKAYHHPDSQDMTKMRLRGYERISGCIYKELATAIRAYRNKNIAGKSKVDMSPYQVWSSLMKDPTIKLVEDINPVQNLKEMEVFTHVGEGGRSKDGMNKASRAFHAQDMGIVSEASVDSSDVGINAYLSANPNLRNLRGLPKAQSKIEPSSLISTSALLAPFVTNDSVQRANFVSIMNSHTVAAEGYHQPTIRTGYETVIGNRTHDMFCYTARQDGKVVALNENGIIVEYADGTRKGVQLGRSYGKAEGSVYPHDVKSNLKLNESFKKGHTIAYNDGFFEPDFLDPKRVIMKSSMSVKVALAETVQTFEDSSSISKKLSVRMKAKTTKVKSITVGFKQNLNQVVKLGSSVKPKDILMYIEDEITSSSGHFDQKSLETLKRLSSQTPRASYEGTVDWIEVLYHGDKQDMSASLKSLADRSDRQRADICKSSGKPVITGQVNDDYRVSGVPLTPDKAEIKIYLTIETAAGVGDKGILANQMKSVIGEVMDYSITTESGEEIDMFFSYKSILARVVNSPILIGTTSSLLKIIGNKAVQLYDGE